jgi:acetyltransferase-like isoleucine patch superfamily enzyme
MKRIVSRLTDRLGFLPCGVDLFANRPPLAIIQMMNKVGPMFLRGLWWKIWLKHASGLVLVGKQVTIRNPQCISVGCNFVAEDYCEIQGLSDGGVCFGDNVTIGRFAMIRPSGYYRREIGLGLTVGNNSNIGPYCYIGCSGRIEIGNNVLMSPRVSMYGENHNFGRVDVPIKLQGVTRQGIVVHDDCWLASGCTILSGVCIGRGTIVAAGAVVTHDLPPYTIVAGAPARVLGERTPRPG